MRSEVRMNYILNSIVLGLHDDNQFYKILWVNHHAGVVAVKDLTTGSEFKITVSQVS